MRTDGTFKEMVIKNKLQKEDPVDLPMDDQFFENMHDQIMQAVEKTEIRQLNRWSKARVFLENKTRPQLHRLQPVGGRIVKAGLAGLVMSFIISLGALSMGLFQETQRQNISINKQQILQEASARPSDWAELASVVQNDNDFYADILNEKIEKQGADAMRSLKDL